MRWRPALVAAVLSASESFAQTPPTLDGLLDRMGAYLLEYETQLSSVVAEEQFEQRVSRTAMLKVLDSDIAFMRLPGGMEWLGFRDVRKVNFHPVKQTGPSISEVLTSSNGDVGKALTIAQESGRHNLGLPRTINPVSTAPLEIIHPRHRNAHAYEMGTAERVRGVPTTIVSFTETARPTLVREPNGTYLVSSGRVWIEPASGAVRRVEWSYQAEKRNPRSQPPQLRVEFAPNSQLGFLVPVEMRERFHTERGVGEGRATYKNFRRFGTSARIVPQ